MSCQQEWYAYLDGQVHYIYAADGPNAPGLDGLREQRNQVEATIRDQGGDPDALTDGEEINSESGVGSISRDTLTINLEEDAPPTSVSGLTTLVADAISGAAALYNPDGSRVVVDQGEYEFEPPEWMVAVGEAILNGALRDPEDQAAFEAAQADGQFGGATFGGQADSEGTTACPHTHTTDDDKVALCAN
jgi:hypothetical protein